MVGIYQIKSPTNKIYVGQSVNIAQRKRHHKSCKDNSKLYNSISKHGFNNHEFSILYELPNDVSEEVLTAYEQFYIDQYREAGIELLNVKDAGIKGKPSEELKERIRQTLTGHKPSEETRELWRQQRKGQGKGRVFSDEARQKISIALKGKPSTRKGIAMSQATKMKISEANKGKVYRTGYKLSEEHKAKLRKPKRKAQ